MLRKEIHLVFAMLLSLISVTVCAYGKEPVTPEIKQNPNLNSPEKLEEIIALPKQWNSYRLALDKLVGTYVALVPDKISPTGYKVVILDRAITSDGEKIIDKRIIEGGQPIYQSRVESKFAGNLSFVLGSLSVQDDRLYDLCLTDAAAADITPDSKYTDKVKALGIWKRLPPDFKELVWVTSVTHRTLAHKEYQKLVGKADVAYTLIKAGADYYKGNEIIAVTHTIFFTGLSDAGLFGDFDASTGLYKKKATFLAEAPKKKPTGVPLSKTAVDLFKSTAGAGQIEQSK